MVFMTKLKLGENEKGRLQPARERTPSALIEIVTLKEYV